MIKNILNDLFNYKTLSRDEAESILTDIAMGGYNQSEVVAFLTVYMMRMVTVDELAGFRDALLKLCLPLDLSDFKTIDMCGTGGDGKNTFNISTLASLVAAGAGARVSKHGNYSVSSSCGSSNVMEYFGYKFSDDQDTNKKQIDKANICFLHAPLFHPAMKAVAPMRKELGLKTFFNMLGPMVNPSSPDAQLVGVYNLELARVYQYIYQQTSNNYTVVHSLDGYDEVSLTGDFKAITNVGENVYSPDDFGMKQVEPLDIYGGRSVKEAAGIFKKILGGEGSEAQNNAVIANAGLALQTYFPEKGLQQNIEDARKSLLDGKAENVMETLLSLS